MNADQRRQALVALGLEYEAILTRIEREAPTVERLNTLLFRLADAGRRLVVVLKHEDSK
jgi:hypothetical protein